MPANRFLRPTLLALALISGQAQAQQDTSKITIRGVVVDSATNAGIAAAVIRVKIFEMAVLTDSTGAFVMHNVEPGRHYADVSRIGYDDTIAEVFFAEGQLVTIPMKAQPIKLEAIVAVTSLLQRRRERVAGTVRAFDARALGLSMTDLKSFVSARLVPVVMCPRGSGGSESHCVLARGRYQELTVYLNEMPILGASIDLMAAADFELVEYFAGSVTLRIYTKAFLERAAQGKAFIAQVL
jgi:hypothetical protein